MLKALVFSKGVLIGRCDLYAQDPPMGVVSGALAPTQDYRAALHIIETASRGDGDWAPLALEIFTEDNRPLAAIGGVMIEDLDTGAPPQVTLCGVDVSAEEFEVWFGSDPNYRAYYGR